MFAFALWDRQHRELLLVRDRLGIKPLYYGWAGKTFVFGSELNAITTHPILVRRSIGRPWRSRCAIAPFLHPTAYTEASTNCCLERFTQPRHPKDTHVPPSRSGPRKKSPSVGLRTPSAGVTMRPSGNWTFFSGRPWRSAWLPMFHWVHFLRRDRFLDRRGFDAVSDDQPVKPIHWFVR